ncbi:MAG: hypothetical protein QXT26_01985 [Thermoproteota archaeon]
MKYSKRKGYLAELKVRKILQKYGWTTVRSGGSLGLADLVCLWKSRCILIQVKSTRKNVFYTRRIPTDIQGFPLYVVVDFGYGNIRVFKPGDKAAREEGVPLDEFLKTFKKVVNKSQIRLRNPYRVFPERKKEGDDA